jgi:hypothetical protein
VNREATPVPALSVIVVTPDRFARLRHTMEHLREQSAAGELEIVVVAPSAASAEVDERELAGFFAYRMVETGATTSSAVRRAAGVRAASAPVIAFTEDHCLPEPGWARALIDAHRGPWAAVGPAFLNGNPESLTSWVNLLIEYGPWVSPVEAGPRDHIPPHNSSYKRDLLLAYGDQLDGLLEAETVLQWDLRSFGHELYLEPAARTRHYNISLPSPTVALRLAVGRMFGAARARGWPAARRAAYTAASPAIPLVRFARLVPIASRCSDGRRIFPQVLAPLFGGLLLDGLGEALGYALGGGDSVARVTRFEYDRELFMRPAERSALAGS